MIMTGNNNVIPAGVDVYQTTDFNKAGAMIYREANGSGSMNVTNIKLGVSNSLPYDIDVKGFAIEMVYIPAPPVRPFYGDGDGVTESLNAFHYTDNTHTSASVIPLKCDVNSYDDAELDADGIYIYSNDTIQTTNPLGSLDPFPTMKALWCMKYEITQGAYRDFLNTLSYDQQVNHTTNAPNSAMGTGALAVSGTNRNFIEIKTQGVSNITPAVYGCDANGNNVFDETSDGEWIACGFLNWPDVAAYLDWGGLAPMSELQFERICRGVSSSGAQVPVPGEFAWGDNSITTTAFVLSGNYSASELVTNAGTLTGNGTNTSNVTGGPLRNGIYATTTSNRLTSGAGFYGTMEMSGNVEEYVIGIGTVAGRSVEVVPNGNGSISAAGYAQLPVGGSGFWPGMEGNNSLIVVNTCSGTCEVTGGAGAVLKGGSYAHSTVALAVSYRSYFTPALLRVAYRGGRGVLYLR